MLMNDQFLLQQVGLSLIPGLGPKRTREVLHLFKDPMDVFRAPLRDFEPLGFFSKEWYQYLHSAAFIQNAEKVVKDCLRLNVDITFIQDSQYPHRLKNCDDAPVVLYTQGKKALHSTPFMIAIVGSRSTTPYGIDFVNQFISAIAKHPVTIVSGLAYGIDQAAHQQCNALGVPNIACLAHGLHTIYPASHRPLAQQIKNNGGIVTEYCPGIFAEKERFPMRNRIIAGLCDATLVIESEKSGGSLITAQFAQQYNRDIFALPGRIHDIKSQGCNQLIYQNMAAPITDIPQLLKDLGIKEQPEIPFEPEPLSENANKTFQTLRSFRELHLDELQIKTNLSASHFASAIFELEMCGIIHKLPGSRVATSR
jgi:DNA processing protein